MSKKHNITYVKPAEPNFLRRLKEQCGYQEGPTVDTKREALDTVEDRDLVDRDEEQPTVVVLEEGDLTAEEAAKETERLEKAEAEKPADLDAPIVFRLPSKSNKSVKRNSEEVRPAKKAKTVLLSFDVDEEDEERD